MRYLKSFNESNFFNSIIPYGIKKMFKGESDNKVTLGDIDELKDLFNNMKKIKSYKLFESLYRIKGALGLVGKNANNNESYFELLDILQSRIFDDWDIIPGSDEDLNNFPEHKFWLYFAYGKLIYPKDIDGFDIDSIFVYNIPLNERDEFSSLLNSLSGLVEDLIGKKLLIGDEVYDVGLNLDLYDFTIKLVD